MRLTTSYLKKIWHYLQKNCWAKVLVSPISLNWSNYIFQYIYQAGQHLVKCFIQKNDAITNVPLPRYCTWKGSLECMFKELDQT